MVKLRDAIACARKAALESDREILDAEAWGEIFEASMPDIFDAIADEAEAEHVGFDIEFAGLPTAGTMERMRKTLATAASYRDATVKWLRAMAEEARQ
ncbi:hypothetical protein SPF06_00995 [Sinomonas sp. JGH33]|uniref:Uncharacterized protein n=1 Tax=Sinomonas terricola TaxID=3110330 RepID=A0ABU5T0V6_9MICC|nr:hypothetical protein [Sinomonas sp. JGH33]MEA5453287.1 hypothetical protein [Sinomonas sp. JGH33]